VIKGTVRREKNQVFKRIRKGEKTKGSTEGTSGTRGDALPGKGKVGEHQTDNRIAYAITLKGVKKKIGLFGASREFSSHKQNQKHVGINSRGGDGKTGPKTPRRRELTTKRAKIKTGRAVFPQCWRSEF